MPVIKEETSDRRNLFFVELMSFNLLRVWKPFLLICLFWMAGGFSIHVPGQTEPVPTSAKLPDRAGQARLDELRKQGFAFLQAGNWADAGRIFEQVLIEAKNDALAFYGNALALFNLQKSAAARENIDSAIAILQQTRENDRLLADSMVLSAVIYANGNKNEQAIMELRRATELVPDHFDANLSLGRAYFGNGDIVAAVKTFRRAVTIQPGNLRARFFLATALERSGASAEALKEYRAVVRLNPDYAEGNLGLGVLLLKLEGDSSAEGVQALQRAIALNGNLYEARINLGKTLIRLDRPAEAVEHLQRAAELDPNNPEPHYQLALAYRKTGKTREAAAEMQIVKKIHEARRGIQKN